MEKVNIDQNRDEEMLQETESKKDYKLEIKRLEMALRESEERFALFMQYLPGGAWIKDVEGRYVYANENALEKIFQKSLSDLFGKTDDEIFPRRPQANSDKTTEMPSRASSLVMKGALLPGL